MSVDMIKCSACGSVDVTEFKAGSYVCGHCEAVFKYVSPGASAGGCEIEDCGVPAIGRCSSCGRRFCATHQARGVNALFEQVAAVGFCTQCQAQRSDAAVQQAADAAHTLERQLAAISDPIERLLAALRSVCEVIPGGAVTPTKIRVAAGKVDVLAKACPELWPDALRQGVIWAPPRLGNVHGPADDPAWDPEEIAEWFVRRAEDIGAQPDSTAQWRAAGRNMVGKYKLIEGPLGPAWEFKEGSTHINGADEYVSAYVFPDGRLLLTRVADSQTPSEVAYNLRGIALIRMAELLGIGG